VISLAMSTEHDSRLPARASAALGSGLGEIARWLDPAGRRTARGSLAAAFPSMPRHERERLLRVCYRRRGHLAALDALATRCDPVLFCRRLTIQGWERLDEAEAGGAGLLAVVLPLGRPRTALRALTLYRSPIALLDPGEEECLPAPAKTGGRMAAVLTPEAGDRHGTEVPFLGLPTRFSTRLAEIAQAARVASIPVLCLPVPGGATVAIGDPVPAPGTPAELLGALAARLEIEVRTHPELWPWMGGGKRPR
jgi:lauroyl/myristoyl acyltransferase